MTPDKIFVPMEWVLIPVAAAATGLTTKAIERMIEDGKWLENRHYVRRGGRIWISIKGVNQWVARGK
jgi:hypothetical protein